MGVGTHFLKAVARGDSYSHRPRRPGSLPWRKPHRSPGDVRYGPGRPASLRRPGPAHACPSHDGRLFVRDSKNAGRPARSKPHSARSPDHCADRGTDVECRSPRVGLGVMSPNRRSASRAKQRRRRRSGPGRRGRPGSAAPGVRPCGARASAVAAVASASVELVNAVQLRTASASRIALPAKTPSAVRATPSRCARGERRL
jgi:hypothetical protein